MATSHRETVPARARQGAGKSPQTNGSRVADDAPENITQIRDILFGAQMQDYERRFSTMEEGLAKAVNEIRSEFGERFEALDTLLKAVASELRSDADGAVAAARVDLERQLASLSSATEREHGRLRETIAKEAAQLHAQKLDTSRLAALLGGLASELEVAGDAPQA